MFLSEVVRRHAASGPDRLAVVADRRLAYGELAAEAAQVAAALRDRGVGAGSLVALYLPRCADVLVAMAGVLGAGAAYTVVEDDGHSVENVARVGAIGANAVVTTAQRAGLVAGRVPVVSTMDILRQGATGRMGAAEALRPDHPAYVLYTSGSTGIPKGVVVTHANIHHYAESLLDRLVIRQPLAYAHVSTFAADLGNTCIFLPLYSGGTVHLIDDARRRDPAALLAYLRAEEVDVLKITPSHWSAVARSLAGVPGRRLLHYLILGGELLTLEAARDILVSGVAGTLVNHYGPTETTVGVAAHLLSSPSDVDALTSASVPIGTPLGGTEFLVTDPSAGGYRTEGTGELLIGGPSVGAGYWHHPAATERAFVTGVSGPHRFYRTGDLVRLGADGVAEFLGRADRQVKINGYRVELDHVETAIRRLDGVLDAAAFRLEAGDRGLLAAVVATQSGDNTPARLQARLADALPRYLVPARIVEVRDAFPLNANGKKDLAVLRRLVEAAVAVPQAAVATPSPVPVEVHDIWRRYLGAAYAGADTNFFAASGTSLDAIALIGDYQALGYPVTAQSFLADPTPRGVSEYLGRGGTGDRRPVAAASAQRLSSEDFSAAQRWFFEQDFAQPDHWNQAILVEADSDVDADALRSAVHDVVALHPLLRTAYRHGPTGWRAEAAPAGRDVFSASRGPDPAGIADDVVAGLVRRKAQDLHAAINIGRGEVFMVHLMSLAGRPDLILLACHHLSVDAVSWRILLRDLVRAYAARLRGEAMRPPHESVTFWEWVRHNDGGRATAGQPRPRRAEDNLERDARTVWLAFTPHETAQLTRALPERTGIPLHAAVLGAFLHVLGAHRGIHQFLVDVEGHGRVTADDRVDVSRVVGWFTDVAPTSLAVVASDPMATVKGVGAVLGAAPAAASARLVVPPPPICYNFLGPFYFPPDEALRLSVSSLPIGPARGGANDRVYELKLTARTVEDQIVLDLSLHPRLDAEAALVAAMRQVHTLLLSMSGVDGAVGDPLLLVEPGSSSGLLAYVPAALRRAPARPAAIRHHPSVLLTGATGFIGIHLLRSLLTGTTSHVHCLVRGAGDAEAAERLATTYRWYFPGEALADHPGRWSVNAGDAGRADFGLPPATYRTLCTQVGAIYHCAGDTRLFGDDAAVLRTNVESVRTASRMARTGRSKELHYVSSLAVAGTNQEPEAVVFSEESLYVGQEFQNAYERSKYLGEQLVHQFTAEGGTGFIYRAGNVSGHSRSGRFQRNAGDNRLVQELRAVLRTGRLPRRVADTVVLSPVDTVAEGILAISQCGWLAGGTFHVESQHEVAYRDILDELSRLTRPFEPSDAGSIAELLARHAEQDDLTIRLGHFWASRRPRNLRFDHTRTRRLLADLGVTFGPLDREWLRRHITHLADEGHFERLQGAG